MYKTINELTKKVRKEALELGYANGTIDIYDVTWRHFAKYVQEKQIKELNESIIKQFLLDIYNIDLDNKDIKQHNHHHQEKYRSLLMLLDFEGYKKYAGKPLPKTDKIPICDTYQMILNEYLNYCEKEQYNKIKTINEKKVYIKRLFQYLENININSVCNINIEIVMDYLKKYDNKTIDSRRRIYAGIRNFLQYIYLKNLITTDLSYKIPKFKTTKYKKIPTYLKKDEVDNLLNAVNNDDPVSKRNYAIFLIAARLGLRISDIKNLKFENIDWQNNVINIIQIKTNNPLSLPLTLEVGNAIIDYIKNYRPITESKYIFIKHRVPYGKLADTYIFQSQFEKYLEMANIELNKNQQKGLHSLRHSFATRLLENNNPLNIISSLLGHSTEQSTTTYTKVDINKLRECSLEVKIHE